MLATLIVRIASTVLAFALGIAVPGVILLIVLGVLQIGAAVIAAALVACAAILVATIAARHRRSATT